MIVSGKSIYHIAVKNHLIWPYLWSCLRSFSTRNNPYGYLRYKKIVIVVYRKWVGRSQSFFVLASERNLTKNKELFTFLSIYFYAGLCHEYLFRRWSHARHQIKIYCGAGCSNFSRVHWLRNGDGNRPAPKKFIAYGNILRFLLTWSWRWWWHGKSEWVCACK